MTAAPQTRGPAQDGTPPTPDVAIRKDRRAGRITFTRPQALNALSRDMALAIDAALRARLDGMRLAWRRWADAWARDFQAVCRKHGFLPAASHQRRNRARPSPSASVRVWRLLPPATPGPIFAISIRLSHSRPPLVRRFA